MVQYETIQQHYGQNRPNGPKIDYKGYVPFKHEGRVLGIKTYYTELKNSVRKQKALKKLYALLMNIRANIIQIPRLLK